MVRACSYDASLRHAAMSGRDASRKRKRVAESGVEATTTRDSDAGTGGGFVVELAGLAARWLERLMRGSPGPSRVREWVLPPVCALAMEEVRLPVPQLKVPISNLVCACS